MSPLSLSRTARIVATLGACMLVACSSAYYAAMETMGVHKREILVDRVEEGREEQAEAKEQFETTYERFKELTDFDGGDLEAVYEKLGIELRRCEVRANVVIDQIDSIESVAEDLFTEWTQEIADMQSADLKRRSEESLRDTRRRYEELIGAMRRAQEAMEPVLVSFQDHVTFLKHNLNARAIASLQDTVVQIEDDVARLIEDMQRSIQEADDFIAAMES